jgi:uncharacterized protein with GYD domain
MGRYIVTGNYTNAAMRGMVAKPSDRAKAVGALITAAGGKMIDFYLTTGDSDFMVIAESDDASMIVGALIVAGASGSVSGLKTAQAFTAAEFKSIQKTASGIAASYKPPG